MPGFYCGVTIDGKLVEMLNVEQVKAFGSLMAMPPYFAKKHHVKMSRLKLMFNYSEADVLAMIGEVA